MRNDILAQYAPLFNTTYLVNGRIKYNYFSKTVSSIIVNTFQTEKSEQFWISKIDYNLNNFSYIEGYRTQVWDNFYAETPKTSIATLLNNGQLNYNKLKEYPYNGIIVATGNLSNDINKTQYKGIWKFCTDINTNGDFSEYTATEEQFEDFYNLVYTYNIINILSNDVKIRTYPDIQQLTNAIEVDFIDDAVSYGTTKTTCIFIKPDQYSTIYTDCIMPHIEYNELVSVVSQIESIANIQSFSADTKQLISDTKNFLQNLNPDRYVGKLGTYQSRNLSITYNTENEYSIRWNTITSTSFSYRITNGSAYIDFSLSNNNTVSILGYNN